MVTTRSGKEVQDAVQLPADSYTVFKAKDLVTDAFPSCFYEDKYRVTSSAVHRLRFIGKLKHWDSFQDDVRVKFRSTNWDDFNHYLDVKLKPRKAGKNSHPGEHFQCGNELSTNGRFTQHVLHVMLGVGKEIGLQVHFGDWDATSARRASSGKERGEEQKDKDLQPDFALIGPDFAPRVLGEGKTPFKQHNFQEWVNKAIRKRKFDELRNLLGQPARYMQVFNLRFGFITNYQQGGVCEGGNAISSENGGFFRREQLETRQRHTT